MPQSVLVVHGAGEPRRRNGKVYWAPLLGDALGPDYHVLAPRMPEPEDPNHQAWADRIAELMSGLDQPVVVGHSFGASTLLKFYAESKLQPAYRGIFLVAAPFWGPEFPDFALTPEAFRTLQDVSPLTFYHSHDDEVIEFSHFQRFRQALPQAVFRELDGRGHEFNQSTFPELVADIRNLPDPTTPPSA